MALTDSTMLEIGTQLPAFVLPDTEGRRVSSQDLTGQGPLLIAFICNHCPYVIHLREGLAALAREYIPRGVAIAAINSNDAARYPDDAPDKMRQEAVRVGYIFPYLFDETQEIAKAFRAVCTPEFYLFDASCQLVYRGQFDASRPGNSVAVTGQDVRAALDAVLVGQPPDKAQHPSQGCSIKWKPKNAPSYAA